MKHVEHSEKIKVLAKQHCPESSTVEAVINQWEYALNTSSQIYFNSEINDYQQAYLEIQELFGFHKEKVEIPSESIRQNFLTGNKFRFIDLFAGIGGIRFPFDELGGICIFSSEWDNNSQTTYKANFGHQPFGDITKIQPQNIPNHDLLIGGFPCQAFSICGLQKGFSDTRGTLFFNIESILKEKQPYCFLLENVKNLKSHDKGKTLATILNNLKSLGYFVHFKVLNTLDFGLPQKRERTIIVGFKENLKFTFPNPISIRKSLSEILEDDNKVDERFFASERIQKKRLKSVGTEYPIPSIWHENKSGNISTLEYSCALRSGASHNYLLVNGKRRLTSRELLRLQGFPESFKIVVSDAHIKKQTGNSVSIPVIQAVAKEIFKSIEEYVIEDSVEQLSLW